MADDLRDKGFQKEIGELLNDFIKNRLNERRMTMFTGRVEDNNDPDKLGRCRIRIFGVFDEGNIQTSDLPWAKPDFQFMGSTVGSFVVPPVDSLVRVYFDKGEVYSPMYTTKVLNVNHLPSDKDVDYPNVMVFFETDEGDSFFINRSTFESVYTHSSGLVLRIDKDGNISLSNTKTSTGNFSITMKGSVTLKSEEGDISIEAPKGKILLGGTEATQPVLNVPLSDFTGAPQAVGRQLNGTPGATYVRP